MKHHRNNIPNNKIVRSNPMRMKLTLKFNDTERQKLLEFQDMVNVPGQPRLSVEQVAQVLIFKGIDALVELGRQQQEKANGGEVSGNSTRDTQSPSTSQDADRNALADSPQETVPS
jgi:hypothetical protein